MRRPLSVGVAGCGVISRTYVAGAVAFDDFRIVACSDLDPGRRSALAGEHGIAAVEPKALLADPRIDLVLNLTPPAAHHAVTTAAIEAGKHVYSEKPLAVDAAGAEELIRLAERRGVRLGCAPDIFLGGAYQAARALLDRGAIGEPLAVSAAMLGGGQTTWHPDPDVFYRQGAGPLLDMGPYYITAIVALLGPVRRVAGLASTRVLERTIEIGPRAGERFTAETPTHTLGLLELESGTTATLVASFESPKEYVHDIVVYGSEGSLALPDPNMFGGNVRLRHGGDDWEDVRYTSEGSREVRGLGLQDMVEAIASGQPHRASGQLAHHVVDVANAILLAAERGTTVTLGSTVERPAARTLPLSEPGYGMTVAEPGMTASSSASPPA